MEAIRRPLAEWTQHARRNAGWLIVMGFLSVIIGFLCISRPALGSLSVTLMIGWLLIVGGIARMLGVFRAHSFGQGLLAIIGGALTAIAGLITVAAPGLGLVTLAMVLAAWLVVDGIAGSALAFRLKPGPGWGWVLFSSIASIILGILLFASWPWSGLVAIGILAGVQLLFSGVTLISIGAAVRRVTA